MAEKEYIEREAFRRRLIQRQITVQYINARERHEIGCIIDMLDKELAADVAPVVHGEWIDRDEKTWCNVCHASNKQYKPLYCPHCGAKMDGGKHRERSKT